MNVNTLILEVTRRCNMCCPHCLRGDAQDLDISFDTIDKVLKLQDGPAGSVTFTGGEPTLNLKAIEYYFKEAEKQGKLPYAFYVVTNGKTNQEELATLLLRWYPKMEEKEFCGVALSVDEYHDNEEDPEYSILKGLSFYDNSKENYDLWKNLINEGRAYDNGMGVRNPRPEAIPYGLEEEDSSDIDELYIAANGNIFGDCDCSFERVDEEAVLTIDTLLEGKMKGKTSIKTAA